VICPVYRLRMARQPRKPTSAELLRSQAKTGAMVRVDRRLSRSSKPVRRPRAPRRPTAAERVTIRARARTQRIRDEVERRGQQASPVSVARQRSMSPDTLDRNRSASQKARDAAAARASVRASRERYIIRRDQARLKAILTGRGGQEVDVSSEFAANRAKTQQRRTARHAPAGCAARPQAGRPLPLR
jgi:hypothetical protein